MGFFKKIKKAVKSVGKAFKSTAKRIKNVGSKIWGGIKKGIGKVAGFFGKLGPLGTIAMSLAMPGIGSMLAGMWSTTAASLAASSTGWISAVGQGMQTAANLASQAKAFVGNKWSSITDKMTDGLKYIGDSVSKGAESLFKGAQEFAGVENPAKISDVGSWVTDKAKSIYKSVAGTPQATPQTALSNNPEFAKMANYEGVAPRDLITKQADFIGQRTPYKDVLEGLGGEEVPFTVEDNPELVKMANYSSQAAPDARTITAEGLAKQQSSFLTRRQYGLDQLSGDKVGTSLIDRIAKSALAGGLGASATADTGMVPYQAPDIPDVAGAIRQGVGGYGSEGGFFLSEAQRRQQALMAQQLGQLA